MLDEFDPQSIPVTVCAHRWILMMAHVTLLLRFCFFFPSRTARAIAFFQEPMLVSMFVSIPQILSPWD